MSLMLNSNLKFLVLKLFEIHNLFFQPSLLAQPLENHHIQFGDSLLSLTHPFLHRHQRLYDQIQLLRYLIDYLLHLGRDLCLLWRLSILWLLRRVLSILFWFVVLFLLLISFHLGVLQFLSTFDLRNRLVLRTVQNTYHLSLLLFKISLPYHCQRVTSSCGEVISILGKSYSIRASIMAVKSIVQNSFIYFPNFYLRI